MKQCLMWVLVVLSLLVAVPALADGVNAFLSRDSVHLGQTVTLNLSVTGSVDAEQPDFSMLVPDFVLRGTSRSQSVQIVNGDISQTTLFAVALEPRRVGTLQIPAIEIGGQKSQPLTLTVLPVDKQALAGAGDPVFVRATIEPASVYEGQQAHLQVQLYYQGQLIGGSLDEPAVQDAKLIKLGQQEQYRRREAGQMYQVVERNYALIANEPGTLHIPPIGFRGRIIQHGGGFGMPGGQQRVAASSAALRLDVEDKPAAVGSGLWLPARSLTLQWQGLPADGKATVGVPLTLTISESASGVSDSVLPLPSLPEIDGANVYPDKAEGNTEHSAPWLQATRSRKFAIVPLRPGPLHIPSVAVQWWNVQSNTMETARLTAQTLDVVVAASSATSLAPAVPVATGSSMPPPVTGGPHAADELAESGGAVAGMESGVPWRLLAWALAALWVLTLLVWFGSVYRRKRESSAVAEPAPVVPDISACREKLARSDDTGEQARVLLEWGRLLRPGTHNLTSLAEQLGDQAQADVLRQMEQARWNDSLSAPEPERVRQTFAKGFVWREVAGKTDDPLPPLYP